MMFPFEVVELGLFKTFGQGANVFVKQTSSKDGRM